jgi:hypothetical protein
MSDAASRAADDPDGAESAFRAVKADLSLLRWIWGWHPVVSPAMVVFLVGGLGYYFGAGYEFGLAGLVAAGPIWYQGMQYVNRNWEAVREGYMRDVETFGPTVMAAAGMDDAAAVHTLIEVPEERLPFVEAPSKVDAALVGVGEDTLWIYDQTHLDLLFLKGTVGTEPTLVIPIPYADIESVEYAAGEFAVETRPEAEEDPYSVPVSERPDDLLAAVRERVEAA